MPEVIRDRSSRVKRCVAEASGTFMLVAVGTGAVMFAATTGAFGQFGIALAFGLIVAIVVAGSDRLGGAHINPAVTIALWSVRRFPGRDVPLYVVAQCVGAIAASAVMNLILGPVGNLGATVPTIPLMRAFAIEAGYTAILAYVIMVVATADRTNPTVAALAIGVTVFFGALVTGPLTGGSFNPARSLGPAVIGRLWTAQWLYWIAPILGAVVAMQAYEMLRVLRVTPPRTIR